MLKNLSKRFVYFCNVTRKLHFETKFGKNSLEIFSKIAKSSRHYPYLWLRDNCKCSKCYNYIADEIDIDLTTIPDTIRPNKIESIDQKTFSILWNDGHKSEYDLEKLYNYSLKSLNQSKEEKKLWNKLVLGQKGIPKFNYNNYLNDDSILRLTLQSIKKYGAVIIENVGSNSNEISNVCKRIGPIQNSHFGADCIVTNSLSFKDRAYTNLSLKAHTDTVYMKNSAGIEMFHVVKPAETGGESLLVDGFYCAQQLKQNCPHDFDILNKLNVEFNFLKEGAYDLRYKGPVIELDELGNFVQIRFNPYHKVNVDHLSFDDICRYYRAIRNFSTIIQDKLNEHWIALGEDQVLLFDNYRLLHGRAAFTGHRTLTTVYLSRDDYLSKANVLGV
ncbi:trimethyllysine mitochondrial isoform X1 [Brachionus plicatilis]|uniref:Trimethyllysine dioxygenase, mitochondrial n=1 Tax=Brachionus plicatilis TaxID=10195 RepID=A0A3M7SGN4_BRAPC|nr:trimethyllysine mitochondrial isoform X1 [Brachionus plicatilis]